VSGHSKWANIKRRKAKVDAQRGKIFTKIGRELMVATRQGGPNPDANFQLRIAVQKAREANMPAEHIQRAILKASGELEGVTYEETIYEGYGPAGVAILIEALTDNRKRTTAEVRYLLSRNGANMEEAGCVAWLFSKKGLLVLDRETQQLNEDVVTMAALEAGAEDVRDEGDSYAVITDPADLDQVRTALEAQGLAVAHAEITRIPKSTVPVQGQDLETLSRLVELLEDQDDVQAVYANYEEPLLGA
jgi:YebC/PmpR family DNA-binding regulatory protein